MELLAALATGLLWLAAGGLVVLCVGRGLRLEGGPAVLAGYPLFWTAQVLAAQLLGPAGLLSTGALLILYAAAVPALGLLAARLPRAPSPTATVEPSADDAANRTLRWTIALVFAAAATFTLVVPVHIWDTLAYHMPMVASYIQNGSLEPWPTQDLRQVYRVNAGELQMLELALLARSDAWVELPNVAALAVVLVGTRELARLASPRAAVAWLAVMLVLTAPQLVVGAASEKNDLVFTAALIGSFYWIVRAAVLADRRTLSLAFAALCGALAGATKVMGLNVVGAVGVLMLLLAARRRFTLRHMLLYGAGALAGLLLLAGTVYLGNLTRSAVPVGLAPGEVDYAIGLRNVAVAAEFYVYDLTLKRLVTLPAIEHDFLHYGYLFPLMVVLALATVIRQRRERRIVPAALAVLGGTLFLSVIAVRVPIQWDQRFMIWLVPVLAILAALRIEHLPARHLVRATRVAAALAVLNVAVLLTLESDRILPRSVRHLAATGSLPRIADVPNRRYPEMIAGFAELDRLAAPSDSVLYIGSDDSWMYAAWGPRFTRHVQGVWDDADARRQVASGTFRFIVIEEAASSRLREAATEAADPGYEAVGTARGRTLLVRSSDSRQGAGAGAPVEGRTRTVGGYTIVMPAPASPSSRPAAPPW